MWRRTTTDPLIRLMLDRYGINLLSIPRQHVHIGDIYPYDGRRPGLPGSMTHVIHSVPELPPTTTGERLPDLSVTTTSIMSFQSGMSVVSKLLQGLGLHDADSARVQGAYRRAGVTGLRFRIGDVTRDSIDVWALGGALLRSRPRIGHPFWIEGLRYFLVVSLFWTRSISVVGETFRDQGVELDLDAVGTLHGGVTWSTEATNSAIVTYQGRSPVVFGVETVELIHKPASGEWLLKAHGQPLRFRGAPEPLSSTLIGDPNGDVFIDLPERT